ncbi:MAG: YiiD C-terminal domain-containing protein [Bacteroidia bacterium]|nr:YiiD C-terminal domain-containing protein [Bacteroidia bacterium]
MDITKVPFNEFIGIKLSKNQNYLLQLDAKPEYTNHLGTVHAAALFTLAEGSAAQFLLQSFPVNIIDNVIPVVRKVEVSYKKPANGIIVSQAQLKNNSIEEITELLITRRKVLLTTSVNLFDESQTLIFSANFEWFVILND